MKLIPLSGKHGIGKFAQVDDDDYEHLMKWKWHISGRYIRRWRKKEDVGKSSYILMHRYIVGLYDDKKVCDHKDRNILNCQKSNLRICTQLENSRNRSGFGKSKYLGVNAHIRRHNGKEYKSFNVSIYYNKKIKHLGTFPFTSEGEILGAKCYDESAKIYFGEFANLNFK